MVCVYVGWVVWRLSKFFHGHYFEKHGSRQSCFPVDKALEIRLSIFPIATISSYSQNVFVFSYIVCHLIFSCRVTRSFQLLIILVSIIPQITVPQKLFWGRNKCQFMHTLKKKKKISVLPGGCVLVLLASFQKHQILACCWSMWLKRCHDLCCVCASTKFRVLSQPRGHQSHWCLLGADVVYRQPGIELSHPSFIPTCLVAAMEKMH